jgi:hypothetical protein
MKDRARMVVLYYLMNRSSSLVASRFKSIRRYEVESSKKPRIGFDVGSGRSKSINNLRGGLIPMGVCGRKADLTSTALVITNKRARDDETDLRSEEQQGRAFVEVAFRFPVFPSLYSTVVELAWSRISPCHQNFTIVPT